MRIHTCTPVDFGGGPDFFARDSGLLCRGFQRIGIESRAVMPGKRRAGDEEDLIRTDYENLESSAWWKSLNPDGVVLYAWGRPKFRRVAAAIRQAGIFLVLNQDNGGLVSPRAGFADWLKEQWILGGNGRDGACWWRTGRLVIRGLTIGLLVTDHLRARHLSQGHIIACVSPKAAEHYGRLCQSHAGGMAGRVKVIPHPVETIFAHGGREKSRQVACVGRWSDQVQKRPWLMMQVISLLLAEDPDVSVVIAGTRTPELVEWHNTLDPSAMERVELAGHAGRGELASILEKSCVFYSPSAFESFGIAAAEALCSGCSIVAGQSVSMSAFEWFVSENSGTLAEDDRVESHISAIRKELNHWKNGPRDASRISRIWCERLHAEKVAGTVAKLVERARGEEKQF